MKRTVNFKRMILAVLCLVLSAGLVACGGTGTGNVTPTGTEPTTSENPTLEPTSGETTDTTLAPTQGEEVTQSAEPTTAVEPTLTPTPDADITADMRDISSVELVKEFRIGWSLGNTLDATGSGIGISSETSWGNPKTSKEMVQMIKDAGFEIIRIPVTWQGHFGAAPDYKINEVWMDRVQEVVDYAYEEGMFVILNQHHESWLYPDEENYEQNSECLTALWAQIAERFRDYNEHLIFEGMNEPRLIGTQYEWNGGNEASRQIINQLNADFVATIRSAGGNNTIRHLMIPTYAASSEAKAMQSLVMPEGDDKIIVSVHAYTPYNFALNAGGTDKFDANDANSYRDIDSLINNIKANFLNKGIAVIIGEFGARDKNNNTEARTAYASTYAEKASAAGIPCIWWDNGALTGSGELFGILNRRELSFAYPEIVEALVDAVK